MATIIEQIRAEIKRLETIAYKEVNNADSDTLCYKSGRFSMIQDISVYLDTLQEPAKRGYKDCNGCEYNRPLKDQIGWQFRGCFGGDYKGKPIAEIELCPLKVVQQEQPSEELEEAAEEEVIIERAKDLYPKLLPFATYICGYAFHDNDGVPKETIQKYLSIGAEWQKSQMPMPEDTVLFNKGVAEGRRLERQDMIKDAVVAYVNIYENVPGGSYVELVADISAAHFKKKEGVKILILRED